MARFEDHILEEIRTRLNLVDVIGEYVQLKKTGQGYQGLCPFHSEKSPSFHVHAEKQIFHCFGCHKGGNAFTFLMAVEGWNFPETVKKLAERTGVDLPKAKEFIPAQKPLAVVAEESRLFEANEWAAKYFHYLLIQGKDPKALQYLKQRGLTEKTIEKFRLGVAPTGWNNLILQMTKRGYSLEELVKGGLAIAKEDSPNGGYDRFRNRVMFPIHNKDGKVVGFGARLLEDDPKQPKYLNSSESALFSKRGTLYGLFENQRGIRLKNEAVIVEGYMDVVGLYQAGVQNAVATMGTAFTEEHTVLLRGLTRKVVTVFDPDKAGTEASRRSVHIFLESGFFAKDLILPDGKDPDEYVLEHGADKFYELCERAPRQVTKLLKEVAGEGPLSEEQRSHWLERLTPVLVASRRLPDRALLWDNISLVLQLSVDSLRAVAEAARGKAGNTAGSAGGERTQRPGSFRPGSRPGFQPGGGGGEFGMPGREHDDPGPRYEEGGPPTDPGGWNDRPDERGDTRGSGHGDNRSGNWKGKRFNQNSGGFKKGDFKGGDFNSNRGFFRQKQQPAYYTATDGPRILRPIDKLSVDQLMELEFFLAAVSCPEGFHQIPVGLWKLGFQDRKLARYLDVLYPLDAAAFTAQLGELLGAETDPILLEKASPLVFAKEEGIPAVKPAQIAEIAIRILEQRKTKLINAVGTQVKLAQRMGDEAEQLVLLEKLNSLRSWQPKLEEMDWLLSQLAPPSNPQLAKLDSGN